MALGIPIIMNRQFEKLGALDDYISFIWTTRYYSAGDFELVVGVSDKSIEFINIGYYVIHDGDKDNIGIIESVEADVTEQKEFTLIAKGRFLPCILSRRIVAVQTQIEGLVSDGIYQLLDDAIINPVIEARKIEGFSHGDYIGTATIEKQITGENLLDTIEGLCQFYKIGFTVSLTEDHNFKFELYEGTDRSYDQSVNPWIVFSDRYDNLLSSHYLKDTLGYITDVLVAGEGEGVDRVTVWASQDNPTGLDRYERYTDARQIRSNNGEISDEEYEAQLIEEGLEDITQYTEAFTGVVEFNNVTYQKDVFMGDVCSIENTKMGVYINARLVEVIESIDESGKYTIIPTFGL